MDLVGIHQDDQQMLFRILAAILHLGNIEILEFGDEESTVEVKS
jgi:myosin heavy subunit